MKKRALGILLTLLATSSLAVSMDSLAAASKKYSDIQSFMRDLAAKSHGNVQIFTLGTSDTGETIEGLQIGNGPINNLVVAAHHGNEYGSAEVAKGVALDLAQHPIPGQTVWVIPVLNVSGYNSNTRWEKSRDPNRDYPGPCGTEGPFKLKSTHALADFIAAKGIVASATLHTFYPAVVYPWGISSEDLTTPYEDLYTQLTAAAVVESGYQTGNSTRVIYPADGAYEDYAFWKHGVWSLLFELGSTHSPNQAQIDKMVAVNVPGIRRFLSTAPQMRAENHNFTGQCSRSTRMLARDKHDE
jgi:carboxypeptidase T